MIWLLRGMKDLVKAFLNMGHTAASLQIDGNDAVERGEGRAAGSSVFSPPHLKSTASPRVSPTDLPDALPRKSHQFSRHCSHCLTITVCTLPPELSVGRTPSAISELFLWRRSNGWSLRDWSLLDKVCSKQVDRSPAFYSLEVFPRRPTPHKCLLTLTEKHRLPKRLACSYWFILQAQPTPKPHFPGPQLNEVCYYLNFSFLNILLPNYDHTKGHALLPVGVCSYSPPRWKAQVSGSLPFLATYVICKLTQATGSFPREWKHSVPAGA